MTCAAPRLLPDAARRISGAIACPQTHKLVTVAAGKQRHRPHPWRSRGAKPAARPLPAGGTLEENSSGCTSQHAATATESLPSLFPLTTRRPGPAAASKKPCITTAAKTKPQSRSTGAIPVLPSLSSTGAEADAHPSGGMLPSKVVRATKRRDFHSGLDEYRHNCSDRPLRKQRRGNHGDGSTTWAGGSGGGGGGPVKIWCCPTTSSLREEACADLRGMARPGLWRGPRHRSEELKAGHLQLDRLKERFKAEKKVRLG